MCSSADNSLLGRGVCAAAMLVLATVLSGCPGPDLTRERFETLYIGQPASSVERKLGEPTRRGVGVWVYVSEDPYYRRAEVYFDNGRVRELKWSYERPDGDADGR